MTHESGGRWPMGDGWFWTSGFSDDDDGLGANND